MTKIASLLIFLTFAVSGFAWTISPDGSIEIAWDQVPFNPYESQAYVVVGDRLTGDVMAVEAVADLEVISAECIASLVCRVTWQAQVKVPCGEYDLIAVLRHEPYTFFEMYGQRMGCSDFEQYIPLVLGGVR